MTDVKSGAPPAGGCGERRAQFLSRCTLALNNAADRYFLPGSKVSEAARYALFSGGKRVRGVLVLAACDMLGGDARLADAFSAAIEMIHAFSLVHDDLPCMDDDDMRRGRPSAHVAFGEANALLAGDMLALQAFETVAGAGRGASRVRKAVAALARAAGARGMVYGQELDMAYENSGAGEADLHRMVRGKTGALIACAAELGAIASGIGFERAPALADYAGKIGLVFQIVDDVLNATATEEQMGKPVGNDEKHGKTTFVSVYGVAGAKAMAARLTEEAAAALRCAYGGSAEFLCGYALDLVRRAH